MWWNEQARRWERHPDCRCNHRLDQVCMCHGLRILDDKGRPMSYPVLDGLFRQESAE